MSTPKNYLIIYKQKKKVSKYISTNYPDCVLMSESGKYLH